jgi:hypothetical protein
MEFSVNAPLPKHLRPGDLRPHPRLSEIEGYLPSPSTTSSGSGTSLASRSSDVETAPGDWADPEDDTLESGTEKSRLETGEEPSAAGEPMAIEELVEKAKRQGPEVVFENIEVLARASEKEYQAARERLGRETDINLNGLASARRDASGRLAEQRKKEKRRELEGQDLPFIQLGANRPSREVVDEATDALEAINDPPKIFRRGGEAVRVETREIGNQGSGRPVFEDVGRAGFDDLLSRSANFAKETDEGFEHADLPRRLASRVRARVDIPRLKSVSQVPVLRPDGSVFRGPGYDEETEVLCRPDPGIGVPPVPDSPTSAQLQWATETLKEPFRDFPFSGQASRANLLGAALTPLLRPLLDGANVPLIIFDATKQGTGKTLLSDIIGLIGTGRAPAKMSAPSGEPEWRKQVTAQLRQGEPVVTVDNVKGRIASSALERALTSERFGGRLLGQSKQLDLPSDVLWIATGKNLRPKGEMTRRCALVRMDAGMVRPWERSGFEHPNLREWVRAHRGELVAAGLTLVRAWIDEGGPTPSESRPSESRLGSFERWTEVVGGVLARAGIEGFLGNLDEFYDTAGREESRWSRLLEAIHTWTLEGAEGAGEKPAEGDSRPKTFTAKELAGDLQPAENSSGEDQGGNNSSDALEQIRSALPGTLRDQLRSGESIARSLGKRLGNHRGQRFPGG